MLTPARLPGTARFLPLALILPLALSGCGDDKVPSGPGPAGLPADVVSTAVGQIDFMRGWAETTLDNWHRSGGPPGANWAYAAATFEWRQEWSFYSNVFVGGSSGSGEIRDEFAQRLEVRLFRAGQPVRDYTEADRLTLSLEQERTRYSLPTGFPLEDPHHYTTSASFQVDDPRGARRVLQGSGQQAGTDRLNAEGAWRDYAYGSVFQLKVAGDADAPFCAAETLSVRVEIRDTAGALLDRFSGRFASAEGGALYTGQLTSELGPWKFGINGHRGCTALPGFEHLSPAGGGHRPAAGRIP